MDKAISYLKIFFNVSNLFLIVFYLYPGSVLGFLLYGDSSFQPKITRDLLFISSSHLYVFFFISIIGVISYLRDKKFGQVVIYLFFLSIILEVLHLVIPERAFQKEDLIGNFMGVLIAYVMILIYKLWKK